MRRTSLFTVSDRLQILESQRNALEVTSAVIVQTIFRKELLHPQGEGGELVLGHAGEEVMLDLEVQIRHPPVDEDVVGAVHCVVGSVLRP